MADHETTPESAYPILEARMNVGGVDYLMKGYSMLDHAHWPSEKGIYMVSGSYVGNDGKVLVGKTFCKDGFGGRWIHYRSHLLNGVYTNPYLQNSFNKYGIEGFVLWTVETDITPEDLGKREAFWYNHFESDHTKRGWNIQVPTDDGAFTLSEETKRKVRDANLGRKHTEETKRKMSKSRSGAANCNYGKTGAAHHSFGKPLPEWQKQFLSDINSGEGNPHWGTKHTEEHRMKILMSSTVLYPSVFTSPTGERVEMPSVGEAARVIGLKRERVGWFLKTAKAGDRLAGWTLISYDGPKHERRHHSVRTIRLKANDGSISEFRGIKSFATMLGIAYRNCYTFVVKAAIGETLGGFEKIEEYGALSHV